MPLSIPSKSNSNEPPSLPLSRKKKVFDRIDPSKIKQGRFMKEGKWKSRKNLGLKGQLGLVKRKGRHFVTDNLSKQDLDDIYNLMSDRLKKHSAGSKAAITKRDRKKIMYAAEELIKTTGGRFSKLDKEDLSDILNTLERKTRDSVLKKGNVEKGDSEILKKDDDLKQQKVIPKSAVGRDKPLIDVTKYNRVSLPKESKAKRTTQQLFSDTTSKQPRAKRQNSSESIESVKKEGEGASDTEKVQDLIID